MDLLEQARRARIARLALARAHASEFVGYAMRDERTGTPLVLAPFQREWHLLCDLHKRVILWGFLEAGKTLQLVVGRVLHALGRDPLARIAIVSNTARMATKLARSVAKQIENNPRVREVFPHLLPDTPWTEAYFTVKRPFVSRDPSVQAHGIHGNVLGARLDGLILDDVVDWENSRTEYGRKDLIDWIDSTLLGRLTADAWVVVVGNAYHPDDALHVLSRREGWVAKRFPVVDEKGAPTWPEQWPLSRVNAKRVELGPQEFARQMLCCARSDEDARFEREAIERALARGRGRTLLGAKTVWTPRVPGLAPEGCGWFTGVDLAVAQHAAADRTALATIAVYPDGTRELVALEAGRWSGPEIVKRIVRTTKTWGSIAVVENVACQQFILQFSREAGATAVAPFTTGRGQASLDFQAEALSTEVSGDKWVFPSGSTGAASGEVAALVTEMLFYDPRGHTGDRLAALLFARHGASSWLTPSLGPAAALVGDAAAPLWG